MTIDKTGFMDFSQFLQEQLNPSTLDRWREELKEIEGMDEERIGETLRGLDEVGMNGDKYGFMDGGMNVYRKRLMNGNREGWMERGIDEGRMEYMYI